MSVEQMGQPWLQDLLVSLVSMCCSFSVLCAYADHMWVEASGREGMISEIPFEGYWEKP